MYKRVLKIIGYSLLLEIIIMSPVVLGMVIYNLLFKSLMNNKNAFITFIMILSFSLVILSIFIKKDRFWIAFQKQKASIVHLAIIGIIIIFVEVFILIISQVKLYTFSDFEIFIVSPIGEEIVFRLVLFYFIHKFLEKNGIKSNIGIIAILITAAQFSLLHILNIILTEMSILYVMIQIVYTFFLGIYFGFLRIKTNSIIVPILVHMAINSLPLMSGVITIHHLLRPQGN